MTFPLQPHEETRDLAQVPDAGGKLPKFIVVKADGRPWRGKDETSEPIMSRQRAAAERRAQRATGLLYDVEKDKIVVVGPRPIGSI